MKGIHMIAFILLAIGGLNWLLVGAFNWNAVELLGSTLARVVYVLVGLSAIWEIVTHKKNCAMCSSQTM